MDKLLECAKVFEKLLDIEYKIVLGKSGKEYKFILHFNAEHFHHLIGLKKLEDIKKVRGNRERIFKDILLGNFTYDEISKSKFFNQIEERIAYFPLIELLLDDKQTIVKFRNKPRGSNIGWEFLLSNIAHDRRIIYLFIDKERDALNSEKRFGRSFFPKGDLEYEKNQINTTLLYKEKIYKSIDKREILFKHNKFILPEELEVLNKETATTISNESDGQIVDSKKEK